MAYNDVMNGISTISSAVNPYLGGAINAIAQGKANKQNQENFERSLEFNKQEAKLNRDAMSILTQARQMKASGVNPASGNTLGLHSSGGQASSGGLPNISPVTGFGDSISQAAITQAQVANLQANTHKTETEADNAKIQGGILENEKTFSDAVLQGNIDQLNSSNGLATFKLNAEKDFYKTLTETNNSSIATHSVEMDGKDYEYTNTYTAQLYAQYQSIQKSLEQMSENITSTQNANWLFEATKNEQVKGWTYDNKLKAIKFELDGAQLIGKQLENGSLEFQLELDKRYGDAQRIVGMFGQVANGISSIGGLVNGTNATNALTGMARKATDQMLSGNKSEPQAPVVNVNVPKYDNPSQSSEPRTKPKINLPRRKGKKKH